MAASPHSLIRWAAPKPFKPSQSPIPLSAPSFRIGSFTLLHPYDAQNCFNLPSFLTLTPFV
jgi:hypothetical protein